MSDIRIVTLTGLSGVGKTTIAGRLIERYGWQMVRSTTTREPRTSDLIGEYKYLSRADFRELQAGTSLLWSTEISIDWYGTEIGELREALSRPLPSIMILSGYGVKRLHALPDFQNRILACYIEPPSETVLRARLVERGDKWGIVEGRMKGYAQWPMDVVALTRFCHHLRTVENIDPDETAAEIVVLSTL